MPPSTSRAYSVGSHCTYPSLSLVLSLWDGYSLVAPSMYTTTTTTTIRYASCSRAISGVPVCYYADRLAGRVRDYAYEQWSDTASQASGGSSSSTHQGEQTAPPTIHASIINSMFFA